MVWHGMAWYELARVGRSVSALTHGGGAQWAGRGSRLAGAQRVLELAARPRAATAWELWLCLSAGSRCCSFETIARRDLTREIS